MSAPSIPSSYTITQKFPDPISVGTTMAGGVAMQLIGDPNRPIGTNVDMAMQIKNLPNFSLADIKDLIAELKKMKMRMRMPIQLDFGMSVFPLNLWGINVIQFSICGEPQVIVDDYKPNAYERCEVDCDEGC
jgi:hypothetical protein